MQHEESGREELQVPFQEPDESYLVVGSGSLRCAIPAAMVRQVVRGLSFYPVPGSQPHLLGLAQFAGEPLAVLDLHALVTDGVPGAAHRATVILGREADSSARVLGLAVDEAVAVTTLEVTAGGGEAPSLIAAEAEVGGHPVRVLDPSVLFSEERLPGTGGSNG